MKVIEQMEKIVNHITYFVTTNCNLQCSYCFLKNKGYTDVGLGVIDKIIELLSFTEGEKSISFFGGEPLLEKNLLEFEIPYIREKIPSINLSITTNATLLTKSVFNFLTKNNVCIVVSLDGVGEKANMERKFVDGGSAWNLIDRNLQSIGPNKIDIVRMTITPENVLDLMKNIIGLFDYGFKNVFFALDYSVHWDETTIESFRKEFKKVIRWYKKSLTDGYIFRLKNIDKIILNARKPGSFRCSYGNSSLAVDAAGNLYACHREALNSNSKILGNIDMWENLNFPPNAYVQDSICIGCDLFTRCEFCYVNIKEQSGNLAEIPEFICEINKIQIFETDIILSSVILDTISF